ncbi:hypothetical protein RVS70_05245 [Virgibacillus sp. M23]|uniref:hypothetical protein n=1 Tax=Virgibacillus sp. M23 TaxID=3079030 RepID=UPI002A90BBC1|nr:hypothetical protein [Virgibacillus sp. M23]MDY7043606.1 hypothetical protein [Virgibacillus sp. M23]
MLNITAQLKRIKAMRNVATVILLPISIPLLTFYALGELSENVLGWIHTKYGRFENWIAKKFDWDTVARVRRDLQRKV